MVHEGHLFILGRYTDFRSSRGSYLTNQVTISAVADDRDSYTLRLTTSADGIDFTIVTVTECAVVGCCQVSYRVLLVTGHLLFLFTIQTTAVDVGSAVFLTQIVKATAISCPHRITVFTTEVRQFGIGSLGEQPDITTDRRLMVLTESILTAFHILIEQIARLRVDAEGCHGDS